MLYLRNVRIVSEDRLKTVDKVFMGNSTIDGAGVRLNRIFGGHLSAKVTDPFLLLDNFGSEKPEEYLAGFPWHPHRGIETVTYMLQGKAYHEDSEGNKGVIFPNDLQWMTAGSGIFHQEMPEPINILDPEEKLRVVGNPKGLRGFQLWINLPAGMKMTDPTYRGIVQKDTPIVENGEGATVKIIAGNYMKTEGPFQGGYGLNPSYMDVMMEPEAEFIYRPEKGHTSIIYGVEGTALTGGSQKSQLKEGMAAVMSREGDRISIITGNSKFRFLLMTGKPLNEEIYWYGPIYMNTEQQIREALSDLQNNRFVRQKNPVFQ
jgi:redox-sensitive bicupin YhaK (pirin superfamily)